MKNTKEILAYTVCEKFNNNIYEILQKRYNVSLQKDIIIVTLKDDRHIIVFKYGVYVAWNVDYETIKFFENFISDYTIEPLEQTLVDNLEYNYSDEFKIHLDCLTLDKNDILLKVSISNAIAQHLKIENFENIIQESIETNSLIPKELARTGKISLSKKEISKKMGELFLVKSQINLHYDLLDTPEFIWEYPEYEHYYEKTTKYLDINSRLEVLNKKVEVIHELLDMLGHEQNHKYSSFLEWIIIILIMLEIIMNVMDHF